MNVARTRLALLAFAALWFGGCRTLPDAQPFADATADLQSAVAASGSVVEQELRTLADNYPDDKADQLRAVADQFAKEWQARNAVMAAVSDYADAAAAIVSAGRQGQDSARALAGSLETLLSTVKMSIPSTAVDVLAFGYGKVAEMRAAASLEQALASAQPAVERLAATLDEDLRDLGMINDTVRAQAPIELATDEWNAAQDALREARIRRQGILTELAGVWNLAARARTQGGSLTPAERDQLDSLPAREQQLTQELTSLDATVGLLTATMSPIDAEIGATLARLDNQRRLIAAARDGVRAWAAAHAKLLAAARTNQPVSVRSLLQTVEDIRALIRTVRSS